MTSQVRLLRDAWLAGQCFAYIGNAQSPSPLLHAYLSPVIITGYQAYLAGRDPSAAFSSFGISDSSICSALSNCSVLL